MDEVPPSIKEELDKVEEYFNQYESDELDKGLITNIGRKEVWQISNFYKKCGSNALFYLSKNDFSNTNKKKDTLFSILTLKPHPKAPERLEKLNKSYKMVTHPFVICGLGYGDNNGMLKANKDDGISAENFNIHGEKLEEWFYDYFKIK